jgi:hypothetical protein
MPRRALLLASALVLSAVAGNAIAADAPPRIGKPRPAPPTPPQVAPLPPAVFDPTLAVGGQDLKAKKIETRLSVDVLVNGRGPYRFIVDSGADTSVVGVRIAKDLQLPLATPVILDGMTARNVVDRVRVGQLTVGSTTFDDLELPALREVDVGGDGMIGIDALVQQRLMMDFEKHLIKVEDARIPEQHFADEIVITAKRQRGQLILTHVKAAGYELDAIIDTGSEITIGNLALRDKLMSRNLNKDWTIATTGVTGKTVDLQLGSLRELHVGSIVLRDIPIAFADVPPFKVFGLADKPALLLGTDILENFKRVSLDFAARKVRFQLRRCGMQVVSMGTSPVSSLSSLSSSGDVAVCGN